MKKIYISLFIAICLIGVVIAEVSLGNTTVQSSMDKTQRDAIINTLPTTKDSKGGTLKSEINPTINITCSEEYCKWSAYQKGLIDSRDNLISRYNEDCETPNTECKEWDKECQSNMNNCERTLKTDEEIQQEVVTILNGRLTDYANDILGKQDYENAGSIKLNITQK